MKTILKKTISQNLIHPKLKLNTSRKRKSYTWRAGNHEITLGIQTQIMGIINVTPDSFSQDGIASLNTHTDDALDQAHKMVNAGATLLDIGGESSRPGATKITSEEELKRVLPVIEVLSKNLNVPLSIDTYKPDVARECLKAGVCIINNIRGTQLDENFIPLVKKYQAGLILMHMFGSPENMQENYTYDDCICEIKEALVESITMCENNGVAPNQILIDPGIGFGKSVEHNLQLINQLMSFNDLEKPILIGTSRKAFIGHILNADVNKRLNGTIASVCASILHGAHIVRVHDIKAIKEAVLITDAIMNEGLT